MHHDNPKRHIRLQIICALVWILGALFLIVDLLIGLALLSGALIVFALDLLYLASDDNGKH